MHTLASIRTVENVDLRLIYASALLDHVLRKIENDYIASQSRNVSLGELVQQREEYLGVADLRKVNFALRIRNQVAHVIGASIAHEDRVRAVGYLLETIDRHLSLLPDQTRHELRGEQPDTSKRKKRRSRQNRPPAPDSSQSEKDKGKSPRDMPSAPRQRTSLSKALWTSVFLCGITVGTLVIRNLPISINPDLVLPVPSHEEFNKPVQAGTEFAVAADAPEPSSDGEAENSMLTKQCSLVEGCNKKYVDAIEIFHDPRFNDEWGRLSRPFREEFIRLVQEGMEFVNVANALEPSSYEEAENPMLKKRYDLVVEGGNKYAAALLLFHDPRFKDEWGHLSRPFHEEFTRLVQEVNAANALARSDSSSPVRKQQGAAGNGKETVSQLRQQ